VEEYLKEIIALVKVGTFSPEINVSRAIHYVYRAREVMNIAALHALLLILEYILEAIVYVRVIIIKIII
jgi:hypothetical protein